VLAWQPNGRHLYAAQRAGAVPANVPVSTMPALTAGLGPEGQEGAAPRPSLGPGVRASARAAAAGAAVPISSGGLAPGKAPGQATPRVLLYERNGLGHGGFDLRSAGDVHSLAWSSDSNLLGTLQQAPAGAGWLVQVWHRSNWHWYLKYERQYSGGPAGSPPPQLLWDDQVPSRLHVVVTSAPGGSGGSVGAAHHSTLTFLWDICASDCGTTVVVDGGQLLMTTLRHAVVPPPMSSVRASLPGPAACVAVSSSGVSQDERVAALLSDGRVAVLRCVEDDLWEETLQVGVSEQGPRARVGFACFQVCQFTHCMTQAGRPAHTAEPWAAVVVAVTGCGSR
jgi:elongator complex protein 1